MRLVSLNCKKESRLNGSVPKHKNIFKCVGEKSCNLCSFTLHIMSDCKKRFSEGYKCCTWVSKGRIY